jgi:hypothetical protein
MHGMASRVMTYIVVDTYFSTYLHLPRRYIGRHGTGVLDHTSVHTELECFFWRGR